MSTRTVTVSCGAIELDDAGEFQELRASGVQVTRRQANNLVLETPSGFRLHFCSLSPIQVLPEEKV